MDGQGVVSGERPPAAAASRRADGWAARARELVRPRRRWCWGTRLVVTASLGWLAFVLLHRLLSGRTWVWAPFDLLPPLVFVAVPVALLAVAPLARPVRWRIMAVLAGTIALGAPASGVNLAALWYSPPPAPPGAITVVSWNTEFWDQNLRTARGKAFDAGFYDYLRGLHADVYLLKEYLYFDTSKGSLGGTWTADMARRIDKAPELRRAFPGYRIAVAGDQITLSRFPIVGQRAVDLRPWLPSKWKAVPAELRDWPDEYTTETLRTDIKVNGTVVSFYNAQPIQPPVKWRLYEGAARATDRYTLARQQASYRALRADVDANDHPAVLGADLNASPAMGIRRLLPKRLVDRSPALPSIYPTSWQAGGLDLWRIDWLLTTRDITVHTYEMVGPAGLSDHKAERAVLSVRR
ncbi:MAG TPA: endonuclease/exonuclease/phosphatase family protein [Streptosporangiaceae bacterium]